MLRLTLKLQSSNEQYEAQEQTDEKLSDVQDSCSVTLYILTVVFPTVSNHELKFLFRATRSN